MPTSQNCEEQKSLNETERIIKPMDCHWMYLYITKLFSITQQRPNKCTSHLNTQISLCTFNPKKKSGGGRRECIWKWSWHPPLHSMKRCALRAAATRHMWLHTELKWTSWKCSSAVSLATFQVQEVTLIFLADFQWITSFLTNILTRQLHSFALITVLRMCVGSGDRCPK